MIVDRYFIGIQNPRWALEVFVFDREKKEEIYSYPYIMGIEGQQYAIKKCQDFIKGLEKQLWKGDLSLTDMVYSQEYVDSLLNCIKTLNKRIADLEDNVEDYMSEVYWLKDGLEECQTTL